MILIALPMYNEEAALEPYLSSLKAEGKRSKLDYKVLILNDGSKDRSVEIVNKYKKSMPIRLIHHKVNKGLGTTFKDLFTEVAKATKDDDVVVTMDSDNTHDPKYIKQMAHLIEDEGYDLIIASRYAKGGGERGFAWYRSFLSRSLAFLMRLAFPINGVQDYSSGYRAYRASLIKKWANKYQDKLIEANGFPVVSEILIKIKKTTPFRAKEIPLMLRYDLKKSPSKLKVLKTIREYILIILRNRFFS